MRVTTTHFALLCLMQNVNEEKLTGVFATTVAADKADEEEK